MRYSGLGRRRLVVLFVAVLGVVGLTLFRGAISSEVSGRWQSILSIERMTSEPNYIWRVRIVEASLDVLKHNPMGTGFFNILPEAHNAIHTMYAEVALGTGIGGLIAYLLFLRICLVYCWKSLRFAHSDYAWIIISGVVVIVTLFVGGVALAPAKRFSLNILHWFIISLAMAAAQASQRPAKVS